MRSPRWLFPAVVIGAWSAFLWHTYVVALGEILGAWHGGGAFDVTTTAAVGSGALLITRAIADVQQREHLARAIVPHWTQQVSARVVSIAAIVLMLIVFARMMPQVPHT